MSVVIPNESCRSVSNLVRQSKPEERILAEDCARALVVAKVPTAILVDGRAHGLARIVEKRRPPERLRGGAAGKRLDAGAHASGVLQ